MLEAQNDKRAAVTIAQPSHALSKSEVQSLVLPKIVCGRIFQLFLLFFWLRQLMGWHPHYLRYPELLLLQ
jgi:hypothetical protein